MSMISRCVKRLCRNSHNARVTYKCMFSYLFRESFQAECCNSAFALHLAIDHTREVRDKHNFCISWHFTCLKMCRHSLSICCAHLEMLKYIDSCLLVVVKGKDVYPQAQTEDGFVGGERQRQHVNESRLAFHSDQGATDLIALLSINRAKSGGASKWVSAVAIHNELLRRGRKVLCESETPSSSPPPWRLSETSLLLQRNPNTHPSRQLDKNSARQCANAFQEHLTRCCSQQASFESLYAGQRGEYQSQVPVFHRSALVWQYSSQQ